MRPPCSVLHDQHAVTPVGPEITMTDKMEHMECFAAQPLPQHAHIGFQPLNYHLSLF